MKHTNKKGFTIVELVIVIAVIAILAAVLIPTFSNLIKKANQSSDIQAARQMNTVLAAEQGIGDNIDKVIDVLVENGYSANGLTPVTANHKFFYVVDYERVVLFDEKKGEVVFPKEITLTENSVKYDLAGYTKYIDVVANDAATLAQAIAGGSENITLTTDVEFASVTVVDANSNVTVDLGGKTLSTSLDESTKHFYGLNVYGTVTLTNGTVEARGIQTYDNGKVIIGENVTVKAIDANGGACVWNRTGTVTINGGVFEAMFGDWNGDTGAIGAEPGVLSNDGGVIVINNGTFTANSGCYAISNRNGEMTINGGTFKATRGVISATAGTVTINGGTFEKTENWESAHVLYASNGNIVVSAGVELIGDSIFALESNKEGKTYNGSITLKAGVIYNGVELAEDYVITQENQASVRSTLNDLVAAQ